MRMSKGYSLVEMMVAAGVAAIFLAVALPFFVFQTSQQSESYRTKYADQEADLALTMIRRDIMHAGLGCRGHEALGIFVQDGGGTQPDELYVNYSNYLNMMGTASLLGAQQKSSTSACTTEAGNHAKFLLLNSVFNAERVDEYDCDPWKIGYQGVIDYARNMSSGSGTNLALYGIPKNIGKYAIGAAIAKTGGSDFADTVMEADLYQTQSPASAPSPTPDSLQHLQFKLSSVSWSSSGSLIGKMVAPAVSYNLWEAGLWRNRGPEASPWGRPLVGALPMMEVTDFQVRCQFVDSAGLPHWTPDEGQFGTNPYIVKNLRLVEVTLTYKTKLTSDFGTKWTSERSRRISVCPRTLVLLNEVL